MSTLDPQTLYSKSTPWKANYDKNSKHLFITFPNQVHGPFITTLYATDLSRSCGMDIVADFITKESVTNVDTSCIVNMWDNPYNFKMDNFGSIQKNLNSIGVPDLWGTVPKATSEGCKSAVQTSTVWLMMVVFLFAVFL